MRFWILHNPEDAASRAFVDDVAGDPDVLDIFLWTPVENEDGTFDGEGDRQRWLDVGGTEHVAAFPAVVYERPEYDEVILAADGSDPAGEASIPLRLTRAAGLAVLNALDDLAIAVADASYFEAAAAVTWVEAIAVLEPAAVEDEGMNAEPFLAAATAAGVDVAPLQERLAAAVAGEPVAPREAA